MEVTELTTETLTDQSGHNLLFVDMPCQIKRDEQEHVCVHIWNPAQLI